MISDVLIHFFTIMFAITNPIGNTGIFIGMTSNQTLIEKRKTAAKSCIAIAIICLAVTWFGESILGAFGIHISYFQVAGGLIILLMGIHMLNAKTSAVHLSKEDIDSAKQQDSVAVVPLALPLAAGPGAISTIIIHTNLIHGIENKIGISLVSICIALIIFVMYYFSPLISRILGKSGIGIVTRVMGLILAAMSFSLMAPGLKTMFPGLA